jgi:hypothetical protein
MRVFVTGTGRCGTCTFYQACRHITNYTAAHQTHYGKIGDFEFPDQHIEVANMLAHGLAWMRQMYPDARWVHLIREREACVESLAVGRREELVSWSHGCFVVTDNTDYRRMAEAYYDTVNANITAMIPADALTIETERAVEQWAAFWSYVGAEGDFEASRAEWQRAYNPRHHRGVNNWKRPA